MYLLVLVFPLLGRDPLLHLTKLVLHLCVQVEEPGPQGPCLLGVLQVQGGGHDPQGLEQAGLDRSQRVHRGGVRVLQLYNFLI